MIYFTKQEKFVVVFLAGALLAGAGVLSYRHVSHRAAGSSGTVSPSARAEACAASGITRVRVSGAVLHPGVYEAAVGSTAFDAVDRAVPCGDADLTNLANDVPVTDGLEIVVPRSDSVIGGTPDARININTAGVDELDALPGIGPHLAERIVARRRTAPFQEIDDLKNVSGIGEKKFAALKDRIRTK